LAGAGSGQGGGGAAGTTGGTAGSSGIGGRGTGGSAGATGLAGAGAGPGGAGGTSTTGTPNVYATAAGTIEVFVNGTSLGKTTAAGALLSVSAVLNAGQENIIGLRASKGSAGTPYAQAQLSGAFGKAGTSTQWKAKAAASSDEMTGSAWAAPTYDDSSWASATNVGVAPTASQLVDGPAVGVWSASASDATGIFRMRFYIPAGWSADTPAGFGSAVTGGLGGKVVTVSTTSQLSTAVSGNSAKIVQVSGTIDFTGTEGTTTTTCCYPVQCSTLSESQYIISEQGQCDNKTTFSCTYDTAGPHPLLIGSNTTLVGVGANATIKGKSLSLANGTSNVIIRNLTITSINPKVVFGGDAIELQGASKVWIDHNRVSLIGRQFMVSHYNPNPNVTISYNEFDGNTPYSASCNGEHYWVMLFLGTGDTMTNQGNWFHDTSGRTPHASNDNSTAVISMDWANNYFMSIAGHAAEINQNGNLLYEGNYFKDVMTAFVSGNTGSAYAPVGSNVSSVSAACTSALGRACVANGTNSTTETTFPLVSVALTTLGNYKSSIVKAYPATEVPYSVPHLAGPGHI
jgi:pectate lyase